MLEIQTGRSSLLIAVAAVAVGLAALAGPARAQVAASPLPGGGAAVERSAAQEPPVEVARPFGRSGSLRAAVVRALEVLDLPFLEAVAGPDGARYRWVPLFGPRVAGTRVLGTPLGPPDPTEPLRVPAEPGIWRLEREHPDGSASAGSPFALITQVPFARKRDGFLNGYHIGRYPAEGSGRSDRYAPPAGFIEVTQENQDLHVSEHFRLRQFLTKDQASVWPKYLALDLRLIDKLELVIQELNAMGVRADHVHVMSGFRTPQYNGPGEGGRARLSRHTYGDAADVWVDNDRDGYIDDLNGDGRRDLYDARVMLRAVDRVDAKYPELAGGAGLYNANSAHGPFVHVDVRGQRARW